MNSSSQQDAQRDVKYVRTGSQTKMDPISQRVTLYKQVKPKETLQKSIVNLNAEDVIKDAAEPGKHRNSGLSQMKKTTMTRRSNLRHALADEKSKQLLQNEQRASPLTKNNLQIHKKELQITTPKEKKQSRRSPHLADWQGKDNDSVDSETIISARRESHASQVQIMNPKLTDLGPEVIIVKKQRTQRKERPIGQEGE